MTSVRNPDNQPDWYKKFMADKVYPTWYKKALENIGVSTSTPRTPEMVNSELENVREDQLDYTVSKNIKLPGVGRGYKANQIKSYSYYNQPVVEQGPLRGRSRKWGDISEEGKREMISRIAEASRAEGLDPDDTAYVLAIAHIESGFNPDAAAGTTSAHGLGQFINRTGAHYGLSDSNRWNIDEQIRALIEHYKDNKKMAEKKGKGKEYIYAYHHDGPSLAYGGVKLAREKVMPLYGMYRGNV